MVNGLVLYAPAELTAAVSKETSQGARMFVAQVWASWFELELPHNRVFLDSRIELFTPGLLEEYFVVSRGQDGWEEILDSWDVDVLALTFEQQSGLIDRIRGNPRWIPVYEDENGIALVRAASD